MPSPSQRAASWTICTAAGSPSATAAYNRCRGSNSDSAAIARASAESGACQATSQARSSRAVSLATASRQPWRPHRQRRSTPAMARWPIEPPSPWAPRYNCWSETIPATMVLPTWTSMKLGTPWPIPNIISASAIPRRPLSTTVGSPIASWSNDRRGTSRQPSSGDELGVPWPTSTGPTIPMPRPRMRSGPTPARSNRPGTSAAIRWTTELGPCSAWVEKRTLLTRPPRRSPTPRTVRWRPICPPTTTPPSGSRSISTSRRPTRAGPSPGSATPSSRISPAAMSSPTIWVMVEAVRPVLRQSARRESGPALRTPRSTAVRFWRFSRGALLPTVVKLTRLLVDSRNERIVS